LATAARVRKSFHLFQSEETLGSGRLTRGFFGALAGMIVLIDLAKRSTSNLSATSKQ
jgi:hypothetical protein